MTMGDDFTVGDRVERVCHRFRVITAAVLLYHALGRRGRNGIWVYWTSLEPAERAIYVRLLRAEMNNCWHRARRLAARRAEKSP